MNIFKAFILGAIQGLTEFLPVSSSGHLVIFQNLFNLSEGNLAFDVLLHLGTLMAIFIVFYKSISNMIIEFFRMLKDLFTTGRLQVNKNKYRRYIVFIIVASIPAAFLGILFEDVFERLFSSIQVVSFTLIITGILLILGEKVGRNNNKKIEDLNSIQAFIIGIFQGFAITPGISRSGSTIVGGLFSGLEKKEATEFSFLISIPAVLGAVLLKAKDIASVSMTASGVLNIAIGFISAFVFGLLAIKLLFKLVKDGKLHYFSYYCWIVSLVLIVNNIF